MDGAFGEELAQAMRGMLAVPLFKAAQRASNTSKAGSGPIAVDGSYPSRGGGMESLRAGVSFARTRQHHPGTIHEPAKSMKLDGRQRASLAAVMVYLKRLPEGKVPG